MFHKMFVKQDKGQDMLNTIKMLFIPKSPYPQTKDAVKRWSEEESHLEELQ